MNFKLKSFDIAKYDNILSRGLSNGMGSPGDQVCIEAAICETLGLKHSDNPQCVAASVRRFKISLNDSDWSSPAARAQGLRDLGLAQLGSLGVVDDEEFAKRIAERTIRVLLPKLFRKVFPKNQACLAAALKCEQEGTKEAAEEARDAADAGAATAFCAAYAVYAAAYAADAGAGAGAADFAKRATKSKSDAYLILSAQLALEVLRELKSPGVKLLNL